MAVRIDEYKPKPLYGAWLMEMAPSQSDPINEVGSLWAANRPVTAYALARAVKSAESRRAGCRDKFDKAKFHSIAIKLSNMLARRGRMSTLTMVNPHKRFKARAKKRIIGRVRKTRRAWLNADGDLRADEAFRRYLKVKTLAGSAGMKGKAFVRAVRGHLVKRKNPSPAWGRARKAARAKWLKARFNKNPAKKYAAQYVRKSRERGGHEEGGWYYDEITTAQRRAFKRPGAAAAYAKRLRRKYGTPVGEWAGRWDDQETIQHGRRNRLLKSSGKPSYNPRRNPKRDGSPTRGEIRKVKYAEYLRQLHKRGQEAHTELLRMLGRGAGQASHEIVHEAPALKAEKTETQKEHPGHTAPASEVTSEQRFIQDRLAEIKVLADDYQSQIDALGDSEENAAEAEMMMEELVKLGKQKKALKEKAATLGMVMTNPGRRRMVRRGRRINPAAGRRYAKALHRIHQALQSLRRARRAARRR